MKFFVDFEATQFSERIISIGCVSETGNQFKTFVHLPKGDKINAFITNLTGITAEMLDDAPSADEAFIAFFDFIKNECSTGHPQYYCYGNCDARFLERTINKMQDVTAITFATAMKYSLIDYAQTVKDFFNNSSAIALKKVFALITEDNSEQKHDALEDAEMLKEVALNLAMKCVPEDVNKMPITKTPVIQPTRKRAPKIFVEWSGDKWSVDTLANESNYMIKAYNGSMVKYFDSIDTAALWAIRFMSKSLSPKKDKDIALVKNSIIRSISDNKKCFGAYWTEKEGV